MQIVGVIVIVALLITIAVVVSRSLTSDDGNATPSGPVVVPANLEDGAFPVGEADAPVTLDLYYDYMCPACGAFEAVNAEDLTRLIDDGTLRVNLRVLSFLDRMSNGTDYSTRAGNAYATVVDGSPEHVWDFHNALYANQPREGTDGLSDAEIADIAVGVGVPDEVVDRFSDETYRGWVGQSTEDANADGVNGTPTIKIDGELYEGDWSTPGELAKAIEDAAGES